MPSCSFSLLLDIHIHESTRTEDLLSDPGLLWWQWAAIGLLILLLILSIFFLVQTKSNKQTAPQQAINIFDQELETLSQQAHDSSSFATQLSLIIRRYLHYKHGSASIFQTNEEINTVMLADLNTPESTTAELLEFLNSLDALKYGKNSTNPNIQTDTIASNAHLLMHKIEWELTQASRVPIPETETTPGKGS